MASPSIWRERAPDWAPRPFGTNSAPITARPQGSCAAEWANVVQLTLGDRIALARKRAGLSQEELATAVGAGGEASGRSTVSNWKNNRAVPEGKYLMKLPGALGVSADWLFGLETRGGPIPSREVAEALRQWLDEVRNGAPAVMLAL